MLPEEIKQTLAECQKLSLALPKLWQVDELNWIKRLQRRHGQGLPIDRSLLKCHKILSNKHNTWLRRQNNLPSAKLNKQLPIFKHKDDLISAINDNQVIIVAGETGSGKTTQLPQLALLAGRGTTGVIGHTQPRRIAARSVATRIADELGVTFGNEVGYQIRFDNQFTQDGYIKLMTDGVLLNEFHDDPLLRQYDTIIIDEAHERSLNIDFILGLIKNILPKRPDLKVIITSATIDLKRFSHYYDKAPIYQVSGRTYPVELRYRTAEDYPNTDCFEAIATEAVRELVKEGPGDILIFLATEQAIRHLADYFRRHLSSVAEILPLYSRLSQQQQNRIFQTTGTRRIILSTNIAETSLTVPGIRYVIDSGLARISRYSTFNKVQRLPIEPISQASANQRMGRCGRLENGICIRLYSEDDFIGRKEFIEPEILRTNLAAVILQMLALEIGDITKFDFIEKPEQKQINDGIQLLLELTAITKQHQLTKLGKTLARLPLDPRLGRILIAAAKQNCLRELVILTAAIGLPDPRERPPENQQKADEFHSRFIDQRSDFVSLLKLWDYFNQMVNDLSWSKVRNRCQSEFIHFNRMREWREQVGQLKQLLNHLNFKLNSQPADYDCIHKALLTGFITQVANHDKNNDYLAPRQTHVKIFPGSGLFKKQQKKVSVSTSDKKHIYKWIVAAEIVQTSHNYVRMVAGIQPDWIEQYAQELLKIQYSEPFWSKKSGRAMLRESATLYGLVIYSGRNKPLSNSDATAAREWFIREGLCEREIKTHCKELQQNWDVYDKAQQMEDMGRGKGMLVNQPWFIDFYEQRLPNKVHNMAAFENWFKQLSKAKKADFCYHIEDICQEQLLSQPEDYPDVILFEGVSLNVEYVYKPGTEEDGLHIHMPLVLVTKLSNTSFQWLIPGFYETKVIALIRGLPKTVRKNFVPVPDYANAIMQRMTYGEGDLYEQMAKHMTQISGTVISRDLLQAVELPAKLHPLIIVHDDVDSAIYKGRDLEELIQACASKVRQTFTPTDDGRVYEQFPESGLEQTIELSQGHTNIEIYQGLKQSNKGFEITRTESKKQASNWHKQSIISLSLINNSNLNNDLKRYFNNLHEISLRYNTFADRPDLIQNIEINSLFDDLIAWRAKELIAEHGLCFTQEQLQQFNGQLCATIIARIDEISSPLEQLMSLAVALRKRIDKPKDLHLLAISSEIKARLDELLFKGFIMASGETLLRAYPRYLKALSIRLDSALEKPQRERQNQMIWNKYWSQFLELTAEQQNPELRMMLEEFHVSLFAQQLGTKVKVSEKRLAQVFAELG